MLRLVRSPLTVCLVAVLAPADRAALVAQPKDTDLILLDMGPAGLRATVTESWGVLRYELVNPEPTTRDARIVAYYPTDRSVRYVRDVTIPGRSAVTGWVPTGPAGPQRQGDSRDVEFQLLERTGGREVLVWPKADEKVRTRGVIYRPRSETTCMIVDRLREDGTYTPAAERAIMAGYLFRVNRGLAPSITAVTRSLLPPDDEAFDGIDQIVLAGNQWLDDPAGRTALRRWVAGGGSLWVMLDLVDPRIVAALLGDAADVQVVDRVGLTSVRILRERDGVEAAATRDFDRPVDFVRVELADRDRVLHAVNGWPASFLRPLGRGRILFTTLGAEAWSRPRLPTDGRSPFAAFPALPVTHIAFDEIAFELKKPSLPSKFTPDDLRPMLTEEIGYQIAGRGTAALVLGGFVVVMIALAVGLRWTAWRDALGIAAPLVALVGAGVFAMIGEHGRRAVPPTEAAIEIVDAAGATGEVSAEGLYAIFTPESGPVHVTSTAGGILNIDATGLDGQTRRRLQTDVDRWTWDELSFPAGVRTAAYRRTGLTGELSARAKFGPGGLSGRVTAAGFRGLTDGTIVVPGRDALAVRFDADGTFTAGRDQQLADNDYIAGAVLSNVQQRRQEVYRRLLTPPVPRHLDGRPLFFAWAEPEAFPFTALSDPRVVRSSLLAVPLEFERPAPGTAVVIPAGLVTHARFLNGRPVQPTRESNSAIEMRLRFQLPASLVPLTVTRATFTARVKAPGWNVWLCGDKDGQAVPLVAQVSPIEPLQARIDDPTQLTVDARGGVFVNLLIELPPGGGRPDMKWQIESLTMEVEGRTAEVPGG